MSTGGCGFVISLGGALVALGLLSVWEGHWWLWVCCKFGRGTSGCGFVVSLGEALVSLGLL